MSDLTPKMVDDQTLKLKGGQTYGVFVAEHADKFGQDARAVVEAGTCLNNMVELWDRAGVRTPSTR